MMRNDSDSDVSRFAGSYPYSNSPPPLYFVQSPSSDSHDEGKYCSSRATPVFKSPSDSPSHFSASRSSSSSRISVPLTLALHDRRRRLNDYSAIDEENRYYEDDGNVVEGVTVSFKIFYGIVGFVLMCTVAGFAIWGLSRQYEPQVVVESLLVNYFHTGIGQDRTGVPTKLVGLKCAVKVNVSNPAPYFGIHVKSTQVSLLYSEIRVALTKLEEFYLPRKSHESKSIILKGDQVPLYGAGLDLDLSRTKFSVPMTLNLDISTQGNVVWFLVKVKVHRYITCSFHFDSNNSNRPIQFSDGRCRFY